MDERNGGGVHTSLLDCVASFFLSEVTFCKNTWIFECSVFTFWGRKKGEKSKKKNDFEKDDTKIIPRS